MLKFPHTNRDWIIATASALVGFFGGGALIAYTQKFMKKVI